MDVEWGKNESADIIFDDLFADLIDDLNSLSHPLSVSFWFGIILDACSSSLL